MSDVPALIARAKKYLSSARLLLDAGDLESSISRAYYAMFFAAEAALLVENVAVSSHRGVLAKFGERFVKQGIFPPEMGRDLNRAFQARQVGDYDANPKTTAAQAIDLLERAGVFVETVARWLPAEA